MSKLLILDGNSLTYRAFFALPPMSDASGRNTNAVYGFTMMLLKLMEDEQPTHFAVAFDASKKTFRHDTFAEYKGGRQKTPGELREQFPLVRDVCRAFGISVLELEQYEADDIIGTLSKDTSFDQVTIVTGDKDLLQLINERVTVYLTKRGITDVEKMNEAAFQERYEGLHPIQMIDLKGLMGDKSDNIPGIPGVGEKTALKLISTYGTVEALYEHTDELKGKQKEKVEANEREAKMSKQLATIYTDVPLNVSVDDLVFKSYDASVVKPLFMELQFKSLIGKLSDRATEETIEKEARPTIDLSEQDLSRAVLFLEQLHDDYFEEEVVGVAIASERGVTIGDVTLLQEEPVKEWIEDESRATVCLDSKQTIIQLKRQQLSLQGYEDLLVAGYLLNLSGGTSLSSIASHFAYHLEEDEMVYGKGAKIKVPEEDEFHSHLAEKAHAIYTLFERVLSELKDNEQTELYEALEKPLVSVLAEMEWAGIHVNIETLQHMEADLRERLSTLEVTIHELAGEPFNINSPKQLGVILFEKLALPPVKKTKTGYSTAADVLEKLAPLHPIIEKIMHYRELGKLQSTYVEGLQKVVKEDGKIHTRYTQTLTQTGRLSSVNPNLQNIPIRLEEGRRIRKAFTASEPDWVLYAVDYSQIELRIMAHMSQDEKMIAAFLHDEDIHTSTAANVFKVSKEEVTSLMRRQAKAVNFGIIYGISDYGLSQNLGITRKEAQTFIDTYFEQFPGVKTFMDAAIERAREHGFVETMLKRRRNIPDIHSSNFNLRGFAERTAINTPIQGTAADIIKKAMIDVNHALKTSHLQSKLLLQVHDELIFEGPAEEMEALEKLVTEAMEHTVTLDVPLRADGAVGATWFDTK
ncbi:MULTISPECIES: DNA polymerase I [unclassified Exiguobacterium]|uniref:DNA polymerase I n=1 Tax=unclassified Exiguobacterium TaxID=2644629 RepID=UPI001BE642CB|nr:MULTISPECIES: DNA polymerase I [unclassified Exiguobacterium]